MAGKVTTSRFAMHHTLKKEVYPPTGSMAPSSRVAIVYDRPLSVLCLPISASV